jgi:translation elongation factor EF-G
MSEDGYNIDDIIKNSFEEAIEYFKKNGIKVEGLKLTILESPELLIQKYGKDKIDENTSGWYDSGTVYIIKNSIKNFVNKVSSNLNEISNINLFTISRNGVLWPIPINDNDIKKVVAKADVESIVIHEIGHDVLHSIGSNDEWKASFVEFLVYFYKNELYKYPEVYKIMERNIKKCKKIYTIKNQPSYLPYSLGYCFANDLIYAYENILNKNKQSPKLNIKDTIEKFKHFSEEDGIKITKMVNTLLKDYINIKNMLNIKTNMLSCLLEKLPNIMDNVNS